ncbi:4-hydroxybenzoate polyprenyltransferase [Archaeoglobales archaeon]|nr:MAG: 4-hydroxybenzoate polyprenyltransferase [Archaeoglobales archaeon]
MGTNKFINILKLARVWHGRAYIAMAAFGFLFGENYSLFLPFMVSTLLYISFAFAINNCFDVETDSKNRSKYNPLVNGSITLKESLLFSVTLALIGIIIASILPLRAFVIYLLSTFLALVYSAPPRLKTKPPLDLISHGLFFGVLPFLFGLYSSNGSIDSYYTLLGSLFFYSCFLEMRNHIGDYSSDLTSNTITSAVVLGKQNAERVKWAFFALHTLCLIPYLLYSPLMFFGILREGFADVLTICVYLLLVMGVV